MLKAVKAIFYETYTIQFDLILFYTRQKIVYGVFKFVYIPAAFFFQIPFFSFEAE